MSNNNCTQTSAFKSVVLTSIFCLLVAVTTALIWQAPFFKHCLISFGYGYSAVFSSIAIAYLFPNLGNQWNIAGSLTTSMILGTINAAALLEEYSDFDNLDKLKPVVFLGFLFTVICFLYFYIYEQKLLAQQELEIAKRKQAEHEKALMMSQLKQLQSQIEPHFLFNTLANISALIDQKPQDAQQMLIKLTDLLRGTLKANRQSNTTIGGELALIDAYLNIQQIRLGNRLKYEINHELTDDISFPPLLLQPLVENAVQHGIEPSAKGGTITLTVAQKQEYIDISVVDTGNGLSQNPSTAGNGIGLENIKQRLYALFCERAQFNIVENAQGGVTATLRIETHDLQSLTDD